MPAAPLRTVIIGAGQAGRRTAEALREMDDAAVITLLGEEPHPPYDRPPLSKAVLLGTDPGRALFVREPGFYAERRIDLRTGTVATAVDLGARTVRTAAGETFHWEHLVFATGARARRLSVPGADDPRVLTLRTLAEANGLRARLLERPRVVVVGGGLIGMEVAAAARQLGCPVTVLEAGDELLARSFPTVLGAIMAERHRSMGVVIQLGASVTAIRPQTDSLIVEADGGGTEADLVVVGIGGFAEDSLASAAGLATANGILTDGQGRASASGVYAAGEVARFRQPFLGRVARLESWQAAQHQPAAVARAIFGRDGDYDEVPWVWTDQYDWNLQALGEPEQSLVARIAAPDRATWIALDHESRARGAAMLNQGRDATPLRRLIAAGRPVDPRRLADPAVDLRSML